MNIVVAYVTKDKIGKEACFIDLRAQVSNFDLFAPIIWDKGREDLQVVYCR